MNSLSIWLLGIALVNVSLAAYLFQFHKSMSAIFAIGFLMSMAFHSFGYAFELMSLNLASALFWFRIEYIGIVFLPVFWLFFVAHLLGQEKVLPISFKILCGVFSVVLSISFLSTLFPGWFFKTVSFDNSLGILLLTFEPQWLYWTTHLFILLILSISFMLLYKLKRIFKLFRFQAITLFLGTLLPIACYLYYLMGFAPQGIDLTPFSYLLIDIFFALALFRYRLLDFVPPALEHVFENLSAGVLIVDDKIRITHINKALQQIFPFIDDASLGDLATDQLCDFPDICAAITALDSISAEVEISQENQSRYYQIGVSGFSGSNCRLPGKIIYFQDITALKSSERLLFDENISKNKFLSILAHDLKGPFQSLIGLSELLIDGYILEHEKEKVYLAINETSHITYDLLTDLLSWAMSQQNLMDFQPANFEVNNLIDTVVRHAQPVARNRNIEVKSGLDIPLEMYADKQMLQTILRNLVSNAVKFSKENGMVLINAHKEENATILSVADTGVGLSDNDVPKLFRIDVKNNEIGAGKNKGTGLGLILCDEFVKKHDGKIWVKSKLGQGSTFYFSIPDKIVNQPVQTIAEIEKSA